MYYVFKEPIDLYPNIKVQLKSLKHDITWRVWDYDPKGIEGTSTYPKVQYQSINQAFRMFGSINDKHGNIISAFKTGDKVDLGYLNRFVKEESKVDINKPFKPSKVTKEEAKKLYPEWYERVVDNKRKVSGAKWNIKGKVNGDVNDPYALYHWWA